MSELEREALDFATDAPELVERPEVGPAREDVLEEPLPGRELEGAGTGAEAGGSAPVQRLDLPVLDVRPQAAQPRDYHFPRFERGQLANGIELVTAHVPGRPLLTAQLLVRGNSGGGVATEPAELGGVTVLMTRAMSEGTKHRDAVALVESGERLGAELSADAGWDSVGVGVEVPRSRIQAALQLMAEMALEPSFPEHEVERLRDERINDLKQARADPRRRIERVLPEQLYDPASPYVRPLAGTEDTIERIDRAAVAARHQELMRAGAATVLICGDLSGLDAARLVQDAFVAWPNADAPGHTAPPPVLARRNAPRVLLVDRPGAPQSEVRVGHIGLPRAIPDFHALAVLNTILGGLFNSRLNRLLREQRGYTYGIHSAFDFRRGAGPFAVRCAVKSDVTVPAVQDILSVLRGTHDQPATDDELRLARDYLVGVFPLRFETAGQVGAALGGLVVLELPDDELDRYRPAVAAVTAESVQAAAKAHIHPDEASIVIVGDASSFEGAMRDAGLGDVEVWREGAEVAEAA